MCGLSIEKLLLIGIIAAIIIGPQRLPHYAQRLGEIVRLLRAQVDTAQSRTAKAVGAEEWRALDPRQYDPRRIIREALDEPSPSRSSAAADVGSEAADSGSVVRSEPVAAGDNRPFAEAAGSYVITGSSGHPRRRFVARTDESRTGDDESAAEHAGSGR